jgi:hypothetical protein
MRYKKWSQPKSTWTAWRGLLESNVARRRCLLIRTLERIPVSYEVAEVRSVQTSIALESLMRI